MADARMDYQRAQNLIDSTRFLEVVEYDLFGDGRVLTRRMSDIRCRYPSKPRDWQGGTNASGVSYRIRYFAIRISDDGTTLESSEVVMPDVIKKCWERAKATPPSAAKCLSCDGPMECSGKELYGRPVMHCRNTKCPAFLPAPPSAPAKEG